MFYVQLHIFKVRFDGFLKAGEFEDGICEDLATGWIDVKKIILISFDKATN